MFGDFLWIDIFIFAGSFTGLLIGTGFLVVRRPGYLLRWLVFTAAAFSLTYNLMFYAGFTPKAQVLPALNILHLGLLFALGPALYLFVASVVDPEFELTDHYYRKHFAPAVLLVIAGIFIRLTGMDSTTWAARAEQMAYSLSSPFILVYFLAAWWVWLWPILDAKTILESSTGRHTIVFCLLALVALVFGALAQVYMSLELFRVAGVSGCSAFIWYYMTEVLGTSSAAILQTKHLELKYRNTNLKQIDSDSVQTSIERLLNEAEVFRNPDLKLTDLALGLDLNPHQLSEVLNRHMKIGFATLIRRHRVAAAQREIMASPDKNLLDVAYNAGFGAKSSFNHAFQKEAGMSPSEYRLSIL